MMADKSNNENEVQRIIVSIEPWPAGPIDQYTRIESGSWGYLTTYSDCTFIFSQETAPKRSEILSRWGSRLDDEEH